MQVVKGIAYKFNIDLDANIEKHNKKLLSRGHKFIQVIYGSYLNRF